MRAPHDLAGVLVRATRALGRRAIVSRGWADLTLLDDAPDGLVIGEVNQQALFRRVAAVVHHGGAGTTTAAALAGAPQVIIPQLYDQRYWAQRVQQLEIGSAHAPGTPTTASLTSALEQALRPGVATRARAVGAAMRTDGAAVAAQRVFAAQP
jgi:vancomycin aglycone glucosyltransferase